MAQGETACARKVSLRGMFRKRKPVADSSKTICSKTAYVNSDGSTTDFSGSHTTAGHHRVRGKPGNNMNYDSDSDMDRPKGSVFFRCFGGRPLCRNSSGIRRSTPEDYLSRPPSRASERQTANIEVQRNDSEDYGNDYRGDGGGSSFYSVAGDETMNDAMFAEIGNGDICTNVSSTNDCACGCAAHTIHDAEFPLIPRSGVKLNSYDEMVSLARSMQGYWVTVLERSESLDAQYRAIGLGTLKRSVMNRLAVPITMFLEKEDTILHNWLHTPLGIRHMCTNLHGVESEDNDPDAGLWKGKAEVINWDVSVFCSAKPVRAIRQTRHNQKGLKSIETRVVLPDRKEGKVMLYNFSMEQPKATEVLSANRILKWVSAPQLE